MQASIYMCLTMLTDKAARVTNALYMVRNSGGKNLGNFAIIKFW